MGKRLLDDHEKWMMTDPDYRREYEDLEPEFVVAGALVQARLEAGMTQEDVAAALGVKQPAVARIESGKNVSLRTLERYARAVGRKVAITLIPASQGSEGQPPFPQRT
ncbi:helix-turn-helix domain-containing protein [Desulfolutivibrio sp.]|uniref:helix-turn-helix domain-containing protein n=1 Tax=Desulfolutivibrio sp. TaxID=2773296 RepID=UPI002F96DA23